MLLERLTINPLGKYDFPEYSKGSIETLEKKGNEGLSWREPHTCCFCQKKCYNRGGLSNHLKTVHHRNKKLLCDLCPKFYFHKRMIARHMREIHSKKSFECNICEYKTTRKSHFERHKLTHAEKVECPICKKLVNEASHMRIHEPRISCPICKKMFKKHCLKNHMKMHTRKSSQKCENCDENFKSREDLRRWAAEELNFESDC